MSIPEWLDTICADLPEGIAQSVRLVVAGLTSRIAHLERQNAALREALGEQRVRKVLK